MRFVFLPRLLTSFLFLTVSGCALAAEIGDEDRIARLETEQMAAKQQGQSDRAIELLRELVDASSGQPRQPALLLSLIIAERDAGNFLRAGRAHQQLLEHPNLDDGTRLSLSFADAQYRAMAGDSVHAREFFEAGRRTLLRLSEQPAMTAHGARYRFRQNLAEATMLRMEGQVGAADVALKRARLANEEDRRYFREGAGRLLPRAERERAIAESDRANLYGETISNHLETGHLGAAELVALDWMAVSEQPEQQAFRVIALKRYGDVLLSSRRFAKALEVFDRLLAEHRQAGRDSLARPVLLTNRSRAQALMGLQRWEDALAAFENLERQVRGNPAAREILRGGIDRALTRAMAGRVLEAEKVIDNTLQNLGRSYTDNHPLVIAAHGTRALVLSRLGREAQALPLFEAYVKARDLGAGGDGEQEEAAISQLRHRLVLEAYLALLARQPQTAETLAQAFRIADALRGGRVQQAIAASAARGGIRDPELARLIREEQNLGAEIANLYRTINQQSGEAENSTQGRIRLEAAEKKRAEILASLRGKYPEYDRLVRPTPPAPQDIARLLTGEEVFLSIYSTATQSYIFTVDAGGNTRMHVAPAGTAMLAEAVKRLRAALDVGDTPLERLPAFDVATAHELYLQLLEPLRPAWQGARHLIVSASGALGELPFSLLVEQPGNVVETPIPFAGHADIAWLVRNRAISHVPSAAALVALRRLPPPAANREPFIGFGDPDFGTPAGSTGKFRNLARRGAGEALTSVTLRNAYRTLPPLPDTRAEVLALAQALSPRPAEAALLGAAASRGNVLNRDLSRHAVVAFATHGLQPGELPGLDEPALAMTLPGSETQSPLLTLSDILGMKLDADWVVLSACNTASGDGDASEAFSGLGRGFFFAGARALLVTHWPVESASARRLVSAIFVRHAQAPAGLRAEALRAAQLELMRTTAGQQYSYAHPLFWAPFALVGDGGGRKIP
ncbi:MAG: CHAT domain-containing protein [Betaproteobacteria bacterium]